MNKRSVSWTQADLKKALQAVGNGMSKRMSAKSYGIPWGTFSNKLMGRRRMDTSVPKTYLSPEEEDEIANIIKQSSDSGFGMTKGELLLTVKEMLDFCGRKTKWADNMPNDKWFQNFKLRHPQIDLRAALKLGEQRAFVTKGSVMSWFQTTIESIDAIILLDPTRIYNPDESGFSLDAGTGRVLAFMGTKCIYQVGNSSAIGQSLLKKMGWKEGAGLGANEDGRIIPVKASMKIDNRGLGCTAQQADAWIAHQEEFDQILASLNDPVKNENNCSASEKRDCSEDKMEDGQRRFYGRFSRGGVKTLRTTEDLNCILGRRKSSSKSEVKIKEEIIVEETNLTGTSGTDSVEEDNSESQDKEAKTDKSHGFVTVTRNCSVQDYFAQKLKNRNLPPVLKMIQDDVEKNDVIVLDKQENNKCKESFQTSSCSVQDYFAQKMKAKQGKLAAKESPDSRSSEEKIEEDCGKENILSTSTLNVEEQSALDIEGENSQNEMKIDNDKKKKKQTEVSNEVVEDETDKKRKRKRDVDNEDSRTDNKKSKLEDSGKSRREYEDFEETIDVQMKDIDSCETAENKENGKKKKKKSMKNGKNDDVSEESVLSLKKGEDEGKGGKKKEKKSKLKNDKLKNKITNEVVKIVTEIDEDNKNSAIKKDISCSKVGKDLKHGSSEDLTLSKNAKKKKRYQTKKVIIKKLEELRDMDIEKLLKRIQSVGSSVSYDAVIKEIEPKLKDKLAEKVALQKPENCETASSKDKVRKLDKKIKKLKRVALDKASVVNGNVITDIDTVQAAIIKKGKRKEKKNIAVIMQMSKEHNADINWKNEIVILKNARKVAISDIKKEKKEILQDLDKRIVEFTKQIEDIEKKFETRSRGGEQNPSFSGATTTKGYLC